MRIPEYPVDEDDHAVFEWAAFGGWPLVVGHRNWRTRATPGSSDTAKHESTKPRGDSSGFCTTLHHADPLQLSRMHTQSDKSENRAVAPSSPSLRAGSFKKRKYGHRRSCCFATAERRATTPDVQGIYTDMLCQGPILIET